MSSQYGYDPTLVSGSGEVIHGTAGEAIANRDICAVREDGLYYPADADLAARMPAFGIAMSAMTTGQTGEFLVKGFIGLATWGWTAGGELYVSATQGEMSHNAGSIRQQVGVAFTATQVFIHPQGLDSETGCALLAGAAAYVGFDNCKAATYANYFLCDGVADNVQIQAALNYLTGGRARKETVVLEGGDFTVAASILVPSYTKLVIQGRITAANALEASVINVVDASYVEICGGGIIDGNKANQAVTGQGIRVYADTVDQEYISIHHLLVRDTETHGVILSGSGAFYNNKCQVSQLIVEDAGTNGSGVGGYYVNDFTMSDIIAMRNGLDGIQVVYGQEAVVENIVAIDNARNGANIGASDKSLTDVTLTNIVVEGATGTGILIDENVERCTVEGCIAQSLTGTDGDGFVMYGTKILVSDCIAYNNDRDGFLIRAEASYVSIRDCLSDTNTDYQIRELAGTDNNYIMDNELIGTNIAAIVGANTTLGTLTLSFVEGTTLLTSAPFGWEIDANTEYAIALGTLPDKVNQAVRWKIWATSLLTEADAMRLEIEGYGGASNEPYTTETVAVANHPSETTNFAADDVIYWLLDATDDVDIDDMLGGDQIMIKVLHEAAGGDDCETDAVFTCVEIEYA